MLSPQGILYRMIISMGSRRGAAHMSRENRISARISHVRTTAARDTDKRSVIKVTVHQGNKYFSEIHFFRPVVFTVDDIEK